MSSGFCTLKDVAALVASVEPLMCGSSINCYALHKADAPHLAPLSVVQVVIQYNKHYSLSAQITEIGDIYNPTFHGSLLGILVDWTRRMGYNGERVRERTNLFRNELINKVCWRDYHINDSFVPVQ